MSFNKGETRDPAVLHAIWYEADEYAIIGLEKGIALGCPKCKHALRVEFKAVQQDGDMNELLCAWCGFGKKFVRLLHFREACEAAGIVYA